MEEGLAEEECCTWELRVIQPRCHTYHENQSEAQYSRGFSYVELTLDDDIVR